MATYSLKSVQKIPATLQEVWDLFSNASNLALITPPGLRFQVRSKHHGDKVYCGQIIEYSVRPIFGIPVYWMTEITHVEPGKCFIDEQRRGPYALWHHQHHFREIEGGVEMTDIVHYRIPFGFIGRLANRWLVKRKLREIFTFRYQKVVEIFGEWRGGVVDIKMH